MVRRGQPYRTAAQQKGASMRSSGRSYRGGYTRDEQRYMQEEEEYKRKRDQERKEAKIRIEIINNKKIKQERIFGGKKFSLSNWVYFNKSDVQKKRNKIKKEGQNTRVVTRSHKGKKYYRIYIRKK